MHVHIQPMFPEITKAVQQRMAKYYLLVFEYHCVEEMLKKGQIEQKEAEMLRTEIDKMIYTLQMNPPVIELADQSTRIQLYSELCEVFDRQDLQTAFLKCKLKDSLYNPGEKIVGLGETFS